VSGGGGRHGEARLEADGRRIRLEIVDAELFCYGAGEWGLFVAGVFRCDGFNQREPSLFGGGGVVPNAARDDKELAGIHEEIATIYCRPADTELASKDEEHLVFIGVGVPRELSLDPRHLDVLVVYLTDNPRRPKLRKSAAREFEGDRMLLHRQVHSREQAN